MNKKQVIKQANWVILDICVLFQNNLVLLFCVVITYSGFDFVHRLHMRHNEWAKSCTVITSLRCYGIIIIILAYFYPSIKRGVAAAESIKARYVSMFSCNISQLGLLHCNVFRLCNNNVSYDRSRVCIALQAGYSRFVSFFELRRRRSPNETQPNSATCANVIQNVGVLAP